MRIRGAPNGWGLSIDNDPPRAYELGEYGRVEIQPPRGLLGLAGGDVAAVWIAQAAPESEPVGIRWSTSAGADVVVYAYDDTLLVATPDGLELDGVTFTQIC